VNHAILIDSLWSHPNVIYTKFPTWVVIYTITLNGCSTGLSCALFYLKSLLHLITVLYEIPHCFYPQFLSFYVISFLMVGWFLADFLF